jgi:hypothetical protein
VDLQLDQCARSCSWFGRVTQTRLAYTGCQSWLAPLPAIVWCGISACSCLAAAPAAFRSSYAGCAYTTRQCADDAPGTFVVLLCLQLHCESPLNLAVRDNANHTLEVVLADVCGEVVANGIFFGGWGWRQNMKFAPPAPPPPAPEPVFRDTTPALPMRAPLRSNRTTSGAAAVRPAVSISSSMVAAVLMGLGMVLLL